jgi:predicted MFS family arabinose efflux permease
MQAGAGLSHQMAGLVASSNLTGYLIGAFGASGSVFRHRRRAIVWCALAAVIATTALMAVSVTWVWMIARFLTGVASGFAFVLGSSVVLDRAVLERRPDWVAIFYTGVGLGIVLTGIAVPPLVGLGGWRGGWLGLAAISLLLCVATMPWFADRASESMHREDDTVPHRYPPLFWWSLLSYGAEGMGYIIPATFMVAMIAATPSVSAYASLCWIVVGILAIPSTVFWNRLGISIGNGYALAIAIFLMAIGVVAPIALGGATGVLLAATTLGATFMGVTALINALARELQPRSSHVAIGRLTASFGVGQIIGPAIAGVLVSATGGYGAALLLATVVLLFSAVAMLLGSVFAPLSQRSSY